MKSLTSKEYINKYQLFILEQLPICINLRSSKKWDQIVNILEKELQFFAKLPKTIQSKVDQFGKCSLFFFLAEAQYHLKQSLFTQTLINEDSNDIKIKQLKAKTYYMIFKQSQHIKHIEQAYQLAKSSFGEDHKYTQQYFHEYSQLKQRLKFIEAQAIPDFENFKKGLEVRYFTSSKFEKKKCKTLHMEELEKLVTEQSTIDPSKRIKTKDSIAKSEQRPNLFISSTVANVPIRASPLFFKDHSEFKQSIFAESADPFKQSYILLPRPQTSKPQTVKHIHIAKIQNDNQLKQSNYYKMRRSQIKIGQSIMRISSRKDLKESLAVKTYDNKSIQANLSNPLSVDQSMKSIKDFSIQDSNPMSSSYCSFKSFQEREDNQVLNPEQLEKMLNEYDMKIKSQAARIILKNYKAYQEKGKKQPKFKRSNTIEIKPKTNFGQLVLDIGANIDIEEKLLRIKQMINMCQILDSDTLKQWKIYSNDILCNSQIIQVEKIDWQIFKRLKSKKTPKSVEIVKLLKEFPNYKQLIDIWRSGIEGSNAIFVLKIHLRFHVHTYQLRLHFKNIQQIAKDNESEKWKNDLLINLLKSYFIQQSIKARRKTIVTQLDVQKKQEINKYQQLSNQIMQLLQTEFLMIKTQNGLKLRKTQNSAQLRDDKHQFIKQLKQYKKCVIKILYQNNIHSSYAELRIKPPLKNSSRSLNNLNSLNTPDNRMKNEIPKSLFHGIRAQSICLDDNIQTEDEYDTRLKAKKQKIKNIQNSAKKRKELINQYFSYKSVDQDYKQFDEIHINPYEEQQILFQYISKQDNNKWTMNELYYFSNLQNYNKLFEGHFLIKTFVFGESKKSQVEIPFKEFTQKFNIQGNEIKNYIYNYRRLSHHSKLQIANQIQGERSRDHKSPLIQDQEEEFLFPEYNSKKRIERRSILLDPSQISMDHYFIFQFKVQNKFRMHFKIIEKTINPYRRGRKDSDRMSLSYFNEPETQMILYIYKMQQPTYIQIVSDQARFKLQKMFKNIIQKQKLPDFGEFQQIQKVLYHYIKKRYKQIGCCKILGFQEQIEQIFNYQLDIKQPSDVHYIVLKYLVANQQLMIKNVIRTYCEVNEFTLVSKIKNIPGMTLMLLNEYKSGPYTLLQVWIFPFNDRLKEYKTYLNQQDFVNFNITDLTLEQKALFLQNALLLRDQKNQKQLTLQFEPQYAYVNQLNDMLLNKWTNQPFFIKQKQVLHICYRKVIKLRKQFLIISIQINRVDFSITLIFYVPDLCKTYRVNMVFEDLNDVGIVNLDQILPNDFIENLESEIKDMPIRFNKFTLLFNKKYCSTSNMQRTMKQSTHSIASPFHQGIGFIRQTSIRRPRTIIKKSTFPQRVSEDYSSFSEKSRFTNMISKFDLQYDVEKLIKILKQYVTEQFEDKSNSSIQLRFVQCMFWDRLLEFGELIMTKQNKYVFRIFGFKGIVRQIGIIERISFNDDDYQLEVFFEQGQIEFGSMFEKFSSISLKESQTINIYFLLKSLSLANQNIVNLKCQFRQAVFNYSKINQVSYSQALRILRKSAQFIFDEYIKKGMQVIEFEKYDHKSIFQYRTNKKTTNNICIMSSATKYQFIFQSKLMRKVMITILYKSHKFYFVLEDFATQAQIMIKKHIILVEENIPHIKVLLRLGQTFDLGSRLLRTYKNQLIVQVYKQFYKHNQ